MQTSPAPLVKKKLLALLIGVGLLGYCLGARGADQRYDRLRTIDSSDFVELRAPDELAFPPWSGTALWFDRTDFGNAALRLPDGTEARLGEPPILTFDAAVGLLFIDAAGQLVLHPAGSGAPARRSFDLRRSAITEPAGLALDPLSGDLFVLDRGNRLVRIAPAAADDYDPHRAAAEGRIDTVRLDTQGQGLRGLAFNPTDRHLYGLEADGSLRQFDTEGRLLARHLLEGLDPATFRALAFAPSSDRTDAPQQLSLYLVTTGGRAGAVVSEWSPALAQPPTLFRTAVAAAVTESATLVQSIDTSSFPSPDPAGIGYLEFVDRLLISDSEVNEIPELFAGNLFEMTRNGVLATVTDSLAFSDEPTGLAYNPNDGHLFVSDDDADEVFEVDPGGDGVYGTGDDTVSSFDTRGFGSFDPEGIAFDPDQRIIFIADGTNAEVYRVSPGPNGLFDGSDDEVSSFDTASLGSIDPEGIVFDPDSGLLYLVGEPKNVLLQVTAAGSLVRQLDISDAQAYNPAGLTLAPGSLNPTRRNLYVADRAVDNNIDPDENDGRVHELSLPPLDAGNLPPGADAGPDQTVVLPNGANLAGSISDDGLPNPPGAVSASWTQVAGPATVSFSSPTTAVTTADFSAPGEYLLRLTANDSELIASDEVTVTVVAEPPGGGVIYLSAAANGSVAGIAYRDEDVLAYDIASGSWSLYFKGANVDLGGSGQDLDALHVYSDGSMLLSLKQAQELPGLGLVDDSDVVRFTPSATGTATAGNYAWFFDASDVELTGSGEDIDAVGFTPAGELLISTNGSLSTSTVYGRDDDLFLFDATALGVTTDGDWSMYLDGSDIGLTDSSEDLFAVSLDGAGNIRFSTKGAYSVGNLNGDGDDIINCIPISTGTSSACAFTLFWDGAANGFGGNIDALSISEP